MMPEADLQSAAPIHCVLDKGGVSDKGGTGGMLASYSKQVHS